MNRNMLRRVELAWPVTDPALRQRIMDECLNAYLHDSPRRLAAAAASSRSVGKSRPAAWQPGWTASCRRGRASSAARRRAVNKRRMALGRKFKLRDELVPEGDPLELLQVAQWPEGRAPVLVVGHQPTLGRVIARLLHLSEEECSVKKGAVWWLRYRQRGSSGQTVVVTVQTPELL
jgi:phosphohistidine phosphatase